MKKILTGLLCLLLALQLFIFSYMSKENDGLRQQKDLLELQIKEQDQVQLQLEQTINEDQALLQQQISLSEGKYETYKLWQKHLEKLKNELVLQ